MVHGPARDEIELTLLGPGYGECAVVHIGADQWMIVDSCVKGPLLPVDENGQPRSPATAHPALAYLNEIGVPFDSVRWILATHWHDDHVHGLDHLLASCRQAVLYISQALAPDELAAMMLMPPLNDRSATNGVQTMQRAIQIATARKRIEAKGEGVELPLSAAPAGHGVRVLLLAPNTASWSSAQRELARLLAEARRPGGNPRVKQPARNDSSLVAWVETWAAEEDERVAVLLGGDLETTGTPDRGWKAVHGSPWRPDGRASLVKVAHHGSANGFHEPVWTDMTARPVAVLTPWDRGRGLPTIQGLAKFAPHSHRVVSTAPPPVRPVVRSDRTGRRRPVLPTVYGRVTARRPMSASAADPHGPGWTVDVLPPAIDLP